MDINAHSRLLEGFRKKIREFSDSEYPSNFDIFFLKEVYPHFTFISVSQFLRVVRHLASLFLLNEFELSIVRLNLHQLSECRLSFDSAIIVDHYLVSLLTEFRQHTTFKDRLCCLIMMFLNAKVS